MQQNAVSGYLACCMAAQSGRVCAGVDLPSFDMCHLQQQTTASTALVNGHQMERVYKGQLLRTCTESMKALLSLLALFMLQGRCSSFCFTACWVLIFSSQRRGCERETIVFTPANKA